MKLKLSNSLKVLALLLWSMQCEAQKFEWVNFIQGKSSQEAVSMCADSFGNQYSSFNYFEEITFGGITVKDSVNGKSVLVLKQNTYGKVLWYCNIRTVTPNSWARALASSFNGKGNLIAFVASPVAILAGKDTIKRKGTADFALYILEFDKNGKMVSGRNIIEGPMNANNDNIYDAPKRFVTDLHDNIYFSLWYKGQINIYDSSGSSNYGSSSAPFRNIIFKFSKSGQKFEWATELPFEFSGGGVYINSLKLDIHGNLYAAAYWYGVTKVTFKGKTITHGQDGAGTLFIWDKNGKDKNYFYIEASGKKSTIQDLAVYDSNSVFISGAYIGDSAKFDSVWKRNSKYGVYQFFARYNTNGKLKWVKTEDSISSTSFSYWNRYCSMINYKDEYFYRSYFENAGSSGSKPIIWDGQKYMPSDKLSQGMNLKFDGRGNILWGFRTPMPFNSMATDDNNNFYFQGWWGYDSIRFGNFKAYANGGDSYIGKTFDYAIFRGNISKGPYCAGDSFYIPYTKGGVFGDTNIFIAEISDEFGNFTGKERELGRIKSKNDGKIRGVLPMFNVASSGQYRIRIRSTSPLAQSFYKADTLRLLIYSRDKANPGPPAWICKGDTLKLNTYGGTKWKWSPAWRMDNASERQPLVWTDKDTVYKIIIADSSGCGAPDTSYKQIYIRDNLKAVLAFTDTGLCNNITLKIPIHFTGGDSNYHWQWYELTVGKQAALLREGKLKLNDTLSYTTKLDSINQSQKIALVLWDECKSKRDTVFITINLRKPEFMISKLKDKTVCNGTSLSFQAATNAAYGTYQWQDLTTNTILSTFDFLKLKATQTTKIKLSMISACNIDTSVFTVFVKKPLKANILTQSGTLKDTTICFGQLLELDALGKYGDTTGYKFKWYLNQILVSKADTLTLNSASNFKSSGEQKILKLILDDNCTVWDDSISKTITVLPTPEANFSYGKTCSRMYTDFTFTGSKPQSPVTTIFHWDFNKESLSILENPSNLFSTPGTKTINLSLTSSNGCIDSITKTIDIKPKSIADFTANDVCEVDSIIFNNQSQDATGYLWKFGDGQTSQQENPKHNYIISTTTTYNVTLVAQVTSGCADSISKAVTINKNPSSDFSYTYNGTKVDLKITKAGNSYQWKFGTTDSAKTSATTYTHTIKSSDQTKVCLTATDNISGCSSQTCKNVSVGILKVSKSDGFKLYPNPNTGSFTIEIENPSKDVSIEIFNLLGERVKKVERVDKTTLIDLDVELGIYFVKVKNGGVVWNQKVLISY